MAYFSHGDGRKKLMLLYFLNAVDMELTRDALYTIFAEQGWMDFFDFQNNISQLEEDAFIAFVPGAAGQGYRVTPHGQSILNMFGDELPHSIKDGLLDYVTKYRTQLLDASQFCAIQTPLPDGGALAILKLMGNGAAALTITMQLADTEMARNVLAKWPDNAEQIYNNLLSTFFDEE